MASTKTLEDMLSSEVDESAVSALVGSLESQLASPTIHVTSQDISSTTIASNHVNNASLGDSFINRQHFQDGQNHRVLNTSQTSTTNSVITSTETTKNVPSNAPLTTISTATSVPGNTFAVTLPGALPASGYISQFQSVNVTPNAVGVLQRTATIPNGNAGAGGGAAVIATAAAVPQKSGPSLVGGKPTIGNAATATANLSVNLTGIGAMQNLATVAARQPPLVIPSSQQQQTIQPYHEPYPRSNSYSRGYSREIPEESERTQHWSTLASCAYRGHAAPTVITVAKSAPTQSLGVAHGTSTATGQPVNMVTQVMSNPQILQGVQIVNFNPQARMATAVSAPGQKTLAPRVVVGNPVRIATGPQVLGSRPGTPGAMQNTITLQPGMVRGTLLVKTDNGQYQLVNVGAALTPCTTAGAVPGTTTYRLQSVPPGTQAPVRALSSQQVTVTLPVSHANQHVRLQQPQSTAQVVHTVLHAQQPSVNIVSSGTVTHTTTASVVTPSPVTHVGIRPVNSATIVAVQPSTQPQQLPVATVATGTTTSTPTANATSAQNTAASQMSPDTAKKKCKNFLSTLLRLASDQPEQVATNVRNLIQGLIDGGVPPEDFTNQLQRELNSSPQPCLIPFLKKSLPYLRQSLITRELTIEGVRAPPLEAAALPPTPTAIPQIQIATRPPIHAPQTLPHLRLHGSTPVTATIASHISHHPTITELASQVQRLSTPIQRLQSPGTSSHITNILTGGSIRPMVTATTTLATTLATHTSPASEKRSAASSRAAKTAAAKAAAAAAAAAASTATVAAVTIGSASSALTTTVISSSGSSLTALQPKEKEKRSLYSSSLNRDDDDINDVAAMGGVNLVEESARIMAANAEFVGTQIRSCKDENFLFTGPLQKKIRDICNRFGLEEPLSDVAAVVSHAVQERLKDVVGKLGMIAEHRLDIVKGDPRHEITQDVKGQLKFLEELDKLEKKRHEEQEREILLRAAKSRSKLEDPEQLKLKQKAKEMQRAEMEEMRQREANMTALLAIGPRKKFKADTQAGNSEHQASTSTTPISLGNLNLSSRPQVLRPRVKRVNLRDLVFLLEQERDTSRSLTLYKAFLK